MYVRQYPPLKLTSTLLHLSRYCLSPCTFQFLIPHTLTSALNVFLANRRAVKEMRTSRVFRRSLRAAIDSGNFLNHGRCAGGWMYEVCVLGRGLGFYISTCGPHIRLCH